MDELNEKANVFDYLNWRGDLSFSQDKINKIDLAIFTQIAITNLKGIVNGMDDDEGLSIYDAYEAFKKEKRNKEKIGLIIPSTIIRMFSKVHKLNRFKNVKAMYYLEDIDIEKEIQISATTFKINDNEYVIAFSGTDDTIIGWKENFNMMYKFPVPAQIEAANYVDGVIEKHKGAKFYITGHSKGGNMALYSTYACNINNFKQVEYSISFDGQGLSTKNEDFFDEDRTKKITSIVPTSSVVGVLFDHKEKIQYIKSNQNGAYQHDVFSWMIKGNDFVYEKGLTKEGQAVKDKTREVMENMTELEKEKFANNLYTLLCAGDSKDLISLDKNKLKLWEAYFKMNKEERKYLSEPIRLLLKDKNIRLTVFNTFKGMINDNKKNKKNKKE